MTVHYLWIPHGSAYEASCDARPLCAATGPRKPSWLKSRARGMVTCKRCRRMLEQAGPDWKGRGHLGINHVADAKKHSPSG